MARFLSHIAWILAFQALSDAHSLALEQDQPREAFAVQQSKASCPAFAQVVKNGEFETGSLSPWSCYVDNPIPPNITCKVVNTGYQSRHSASVSGSNGPYDYGMIGGIVQKIPICKNVTFRLTYSIYQVPKGTDYDPVNGAKPSMSVYLFPPTGGLTYSLGDFDFNKTGYSWYVDQGPNVNPFGFRAAGRWTTFTAPFPYAQPGNWTVYFKHFISTLSDAKRKTTLSVRIDNVSAQPRHP